MKKKNVWRIRIRKSYLAVVLGLLTILVLEGLLYYYTNDDFLLRYHTESEHYAPELRGVNQNLNHYPVVLLNKVEPPFSFFGYCFYFVVLSGLYIIYKRSAGGLILLCWLVPLLSYLQYGSMSLTEYLLIQRIWRFLCVLTIPSSLMIAYLLTDIKIPLKKYFVILILGFLAVSSVYYAQEITSLMKVSMLDFRQTAEFLKEQPYRNIYLDYDTRGKLDFLLQYKRSEYLKDIQHVKGPEQISNAYIVVNASRGFVEVRENRRSLPSFIFNPPKNWQIVKVISDSNVGFYKTYNTTIYYAP